MPITYHEGGHKLAIQSLIDVGKTNKYTMRAGKRVVINVEKRKTIAKLNARVTTNTFNIVTARFEARSALSQFQIVP